ncbi:hypothetical protein V8C86DRAFT_1034470 [Haematococcus lacustris]
MHDWHAYKYCWQCQTSRNTSYDQSQHPTHVANQCMWPPQSHTLHVLPCLHGQEVPGPCSARLTSTWVLPGGAGCLVSCLPHSTSTTGPEEAASTLAALRPAGPCKARALWLHCLSGGAPGCRWPLGQVLYGCHRAGSCTPARGYLATWHRIPLTTKGQPGAKPTLHGLNLTLIAHASWQCFLSLHSLQCPVHGIAAPPS